MLHTATPACNIKTIIHRQWMNTQAKPFTQKEHTMKLYDALDTMRIFCKALDGHTPEISPETHAENWDTHNHISYTFTYKGMMLWLTISQRSKTNDIHARMYDRVLERWIVDIVSRPEFVLDVVKQAAVRYPASKQVA